MKISHIFLVALTLFFFALNANANSIDREALAAEVYEKELWDRRGEEQNDGGWKTWNSIKKSFRPVTDWFRNDLPRHTPQTLYYSAKDKAEDASDYIKDTHLYGAVSNKWNQFSDWISNAANNLKRKTFNQIYNDAGENISRADDTVGGFIDNYAQ